MLEGLIMKKPILNIYLDQRSYKFEFENDNAVLGISYNDDIDLNIKKIINDEQLRSTLVKNGTEHVLKYLSEREANKTMKEVYESHVKLMENRVRNFLQEADTIGAPTGEVLCTYKQTKKGDRRFNSSSPNSFLMRLQT